MRSYYLANLAKRIRNVLLWFIPLAVLVMGLIFATGDYLGWWEKVSGRKSISQSMDRLKRATAWPEVIIYCDDFRFPALQKFISQRTSNRDIILRAKQGLIPNSIARMPDGNMNKYFDGNWAKYFAQPQSSLLAYFYEFTMPGRSIDSSKFRIACTVGDVDEWINKARNSERFYFSSLLLGLLSIFGLLLRSRRT